jgi:hypothetical protein
MARLQIAFIFLAVAAFLLLALTDGDAAYSVQAFVPDWIAP